jgi:molecular chaperone GrpE
MQKPFLELFMSEPVNTENPVTEEVTTLSPQDISKLQEEARINLEGWQRARAEFANYKKRIEKEIKDASDNGAVGAVKQMLPIMDDFARALDNIPDDLKNNPWVTGTALILKKFDKVLEAHNIQEIDPVGQPFDPHQHEAVGTDDSDEYASGTVTATLQKGYISGERVVRPALVRVAN